MATNYPGSLDSLPRPTSSTAMDATGYEGDVIIDNLSDAVEAIETELGTDPAGAFATVKERLAPREMRHTGRMFTSGAYSTSASGGSHAQVALWYPFIFYGETVASLGVQVSTLESGATCRLGVYNSSGSAVGGLLNDLGTVDASSTGMKTATCNQSYYGLKWLCAWTSNHSSVRYTKASVTMSDLLGAAGGTEWNKVGYALTATAVDYSAGLPSTPPSLSYASSTSNSNPVQIMVTL